MKARRGALDPVEAVFDRMDAWRHLPKYQLERRSDVFFSLYLPEVLEAKLGFPVCADVLPEFPVHKATIYSDHRGEDCCNVDYLALSADGSQPVFVELKTDQASRRLQQDDYLLKAQQVGLPTLLEGVCSIFRATSRQYRHKWFVLLLRLEAMGLLEVPDRLRGIIAGPDHRGASEVSRGIIVTAPVAVPRIVYVQPHAEADDRINAITFDEFAEVVARHPDPVSQRFAASLVEWARVPAGESGQR